jgi:hypothetical protein
VDFTQGQAVALTRDLMVVRTRGLAAALIRGQVAALIRGLAVAPTLVQAVAPTQAQAVAPIRAQAVEPTLVQGDLATRVLAMVLMTNGIAHLPTVSDTDKLKIKISKSSTRSHAPAWECGSGFEHVVFYINNFSGSGTLVPPGESKASPPVLFHM